MQAGINGIIGTNFSNSPVSAIHTMKSLALPLWIDLVYVLLTVKKKNNSSCRQWDKPAEE